MVANLACLFALLLCIISSGCSVNWRKEFSESTWRGYDQPARTPCAFGTAQRLSKFATHGTFIQEGKLVTISFLNNAGMEALAKQGCTGCHKEGGQLPSPEYTANYLNDHGAGQLIELLPPGPEDQLQELWRAEAVRVMRGETVP